MLRLTSIAYGIRYASARGMMVTGKQPAAYPTVVVVSQQTSIYTPMKNHNNNKHPNAKIVPLIRAHNLQPLTNARPPDLHILPHWHNAILFQPISLPLLPFERIARAIRNTDMGFIFIFILATAAANTESVEHSGGSLEALAVELAFDLPAATDGAAGGGGCDVCLCRS
jgi:hypothetical protein